MTAIREIIGALFVVAICFIIARGVYVRRVQKIRSRLIYGPKKAKRKENQ